MWNGNASSADAAVMPSEIIDVQLRYLTCAVIWCTACGTFVAVCERVSVWAPWEIKALCPMCAANRRHALAP